VSKHFGGGIGQKKQQERSAPLLKTAKDKTKNVNPLV